VGAVDFVNTTKAD